MPLVGQEIAHFSSKIFLILTNGVKIPPPPKDYIFLHIILEHKKVHYNYVVLVKGNGSYSYPLCSWKMYTDIFPKYLV